ncbi:hypothetical protein [Virgibacillus subterraneus]|nr:hypothetical protein [Virgibacillus subterraneus]
MRNLLWKRLKEDQTGFSKVQQQVKLAEKILNEANNPAINN